MFAKNFQPVYTLPSVSDRIPMKPYINRILFIITFITIIFIIFLSSACTHSGNQPPKIINLKADATRLYPKGSTELQCLASDPEGDAMTFTCHALRAPSQEAGL